MSLDIVEPEADLEPDLEPALRLVLEPAPPEPWAEPPAAGAPKRGRAALEPSADVLDHLPAYTWRVMHDVAWPGRPGQLIDHIVIGPAGIFVIDIRHWEGPVVLEDGILRAEGRPREREVAEAADAALDVAAVLDRVDPRWVVPVLCLVRDEPVAGMTRGVVYCSSNFLEQMITSRREVIGPDRARFIAQFLEFRLARDAGPIESEPVLAAAAVLAAPRPRRRRGLFADGLGVIALRATAIGLAIAALVGDPALISRGADLIASILTVG